MAVTRTVQTAQAVRCYNRRIRFAILGALAATMLALAGCGSGGSGGISGGGVDFTLSVSPGSQTVAAGSTVAYSVTANQQSGLGSLVQLSVSGLPQGAAARFSEQTLSVPGTANLFILTATNTPLQTFTLAITGSDLTGTETTQAMMTVTAGPPVLDFVMDVTPAIQTTLGGGSVDYQVSVSSNNAAPVTLAVTGLPVGATGTFNPPSITGTGVSTLTVATQNPTAPASYGLSVAGTDPTGTQKVPVILNIPSVDFTLDQQIGPAGVTAGGNIIGTVTATPVLGTLGTVSLSVLSGLPAGASASFNPTVLGGAITSSTMTITTPTSLAPGAYQITVAGTDASGMETAQIPFQVFTGNPSAGFFLAAVPNQQEVQPGAQALYTIIVSNNGGTVPAVTFAFTGLPLNSAATITPLGNNAFQLSVSTDPLSDPTVADILITATGPSGTQQIDVSLQID